MKNRLPFDEHELLLKMKKGDHDAFEVLYHEHSLEVYRRLLLMVKSADLAEELTQKVFIKIWESRAKIEANDSFKFFLYRIGKNMAIDFYREVSRNRNLLDEITKAQTGISYETEEAILLQETNQLFEKALEAFPPQQKQVFRLCKMQGLSYREVSDLLGISTSTISNHIIGLGSSPV